jgi:hypothetical protein
MVPEDAGLPVMTLYGALATVKIRGFTPNTTGLLESFARVILNLYG